MWPTSVPASTVTDSPSEDPDDNNDDDLDDDYDDEASELIIIDDDAAADCEHNYDEVENEPDSFSCDQTVFFLYSNPQHDRRQ